MGKMKKTAGKKGKGIKMEALPSAHAIRVDPVIADDLKAKASKAVAAKERKDKGEDKPKKVKKEVDEEVDEFDLMASDKALNKSLSQKLGTPTKEKKKRAPKTSPGAKKGEKKKNPWSDSDASDVDGDLSDVMDDVEVAPRERATGGRRAAANKAKFKFDDSGDSDKSDSEEELHDNTGVKEADFKGSKVSDESDDDSHFIEPTPPKKKPAPTKKKIVAKSFDSDSDSDKPNGNGNGHAMNAPKKLTSNDDLFDSMISNGDEKPAAKKKPVKKKTVSDDDGSGSDFDSKPKKAAAKKAAAKKPPAKKPKYDSDSEDFNMDDVAPARDRPGRGKKTVNYGGSDSGSDSDFV